MTRIRESTYINYQEADAWTVSCRDVFDLAAAQGKLPVDTKSRIAEDGNAFRSYEYEILSPHGMRLHRRYESFLDKPIDWLRKWKEKKKW